MALFTEEFLKLFQDRLKGLSVEGYVMMKEGKTFQQAVEEISEFLMITPEYQVPKKVVTDTTMLPCRKCGGEPIVSGLCIEHV